MTETMKPMPAQVDMQRLAQDLASNPKGPGRLGRVDLPTTAIACCFGRHRQRAARR